MKQKLEFYKTESIKLQSEAQSLRTGKVDMLTRAQALKEKELQALKNSDKINQNVQENQYIVNEGTKDYTGHRPDENKDKMKSNKKGYEKDKEE